MFVDCASNRRYSRDARSDSFLKYRDIAQAGEMPSRFLTDRITLIDAHCKLTVQASAVADGPRDGRTCYRVT